MLIYSIIHKSLRLFFMATLGAAAWPLAALAGSEDFVNFPATGSTYSNGTFVGRDGSTWTYVSCRGDKVINAPSPCLNKGANPAASITSGVLTGGCGDLTLQWKRIYASGANLDVLVNDIVRYNVTGGVANVTNTAGPIAISQAGNFTLKFVQHDANAGQVTIDNVSWTPYSGGGTHPPQLVLNPSSTNVLMGITNLLAVAVTASEADGDPLRLWGTGLPVGAVFAGATGASPLACTFSWTPSLAQTGTHAIVFNAGDKDGTNRQTLVVTVVSNKTYYYAALGKAGTELRDALHEIISTGSRQLSDTQEDAAMKDLDTDPANTNNVILLYRRISMAKSLYNDDLGWNKEHAWPESRGLGSAGPDQNDVHNLFAADKSVNALRGNLYFDESNTADPGYVVPAHSNAPETSKDSNSWEPPTSVKGDLARAIFYMDVRYDGMEADTMDLCAQEAQSEPAEGRMGVLGTLLAWHAADPPDATESNRNEKIYQLYQYNRNPFIDHPEWVASVFDTNALPPSLPAIATQHGVAGARLSFVVNAQPTGGDPVTLSMSNAPAGAMFYPTNASGTFVWTPTNAGTFAVDFYAADNDGVAHQSVQIEISQPAQPIVLLRYDFEDAQTNYTALPAYQYALLSATAVDSYDHAPNTGLAGDPAKSIADSGWNVAGLSAYFNFSVSVSNGYEAVVSSLSFSDRASNTGAQDWQLRSSQDGYSAILGSGATHTSFASNRASFSELIISNASVEFRIYGQNASDASGTWRLDNLRLFGFIRACINEDVDHDGLPDAWEEQYFGGATNAAAGEDPDHDTMDNLQELIAGSHPMDSNSFLSAEFSWHAAGWTITSAAASTGRIYTLEQAGTLASASPTWEPVHTTNDLDNGLLFFTVPELEDQRTYRIRAEMP